MKLAEAERSLVGTKSATATRRRRPRAIARASRRAASATIATATTPSAKSRTSRAAFIGLTVLLALELPSGRSSS